MPDLIYVLAVLACPLMMGAIMLFMMRGKHESDVSVDTSDEVNRLRAEVQRLRADGPLDRKPPTS
jgi:hypothetical protein